MDESAVVVHITAVVISQWLLFVCDPCIIVDNIFVEVFSSYLHMQGGEPLVREWIEVHIVTLLPLVE